MAQNLVVQLECRGPAQLLVMACVTSDDARLVWASSGEDDIEAKGGVPCSPVSPSQSFFHRRTFKAALAGALALTAVMGISTAVVPAVAARAAVAEPPPRNSERLFEDIKYCGDCECGCEAFYKHCATGNSDNKTSIAGNCCFDCCCYDEVVTVVKSTTVQVPSKGLVASVKEWDLQRVWESWLGPLICVVGLGFAMYVFLNAVFPTPAGGGLK